MPAASRGVYLDMRRLDRIIDKMPERAEQLVATIANDVRTDAVVNTVRIETGTMRRGWVAQRLQRFLWRVGNRVYYSVFHEYGTTTLSPSPMLGPALERQRRLLPKLVRELFRR